ncbi:uncharacterized protein [Oscarella lobularis]|uniref:uncharacterized protein n=1 Tax=Oscarella lobularis TaxID=121494 RepID=UPI003313F135
MPKAKKKPAVRYALSPYVKLRSAPITPTTPARRKPTPMPATATRTSAGDGEDATPVRRQASVRRRQDHSRSLDKFYGFNFEELRNWLFQVDAIAEADDWDDNEKLRNARVALAGRAHSEVVAFERQKKKQGRVVTWTMFTVFLKRKFGPSDPQVYYTEKLIECKQEAREDVESYSTRFRTLVYELLEADPAALSEGMQVQHIKNGLRHEFRAEIMRSERYTAPNSLDEAEEAARVGEKIWKAGAKAASECLAVGTGAQHTRNRRTSIDRNHREATRTTSRGRSNASDLEMIIRTQTRLLEELVEHQRGIREALDKQSRAQEQLKPAPKRCDYCNKKGYTIEQCYRRRNELEKIKREGDPTVAGAVHSIGSGRGDEMQIDGITVGGGRPTRILFDSGAAVSLVSREFVDEIGMTITGGTPSIYTVANGGSLTCDGTVRLEVEAGVFKMPFEFVVSKEIPLPVIVGKDFMHAADASMEFREGTVVLRGDQGDQRVKVLSVLSETDRVPSGKASECPGRVCAVLATGYQPGLVTLAEEPPRRAMEAEIAEVESVAVDEAEPEHDEGQEIEIGDQLAEPASIDKTVPHTLEKMLPDFDIDPDLTEDQKEALLDLLKKHAKAFATSPDDLGRMKGVVHEIDTGQNRPVNQPPRRLPPAPKMLEAERQVDRMLRRGIIRKSKSPWESPALLRDKKEPSGSASISEPECAHEEGQVSPAQNR